MEEIVPDTEQIADLELEAVDALADTVPQSVPCVFLKITSGFSALFGADIYNRMEQLRIRIQGLGRDWQRIPEICVFYHTLQFPIAILKIDNMPVNRRTEQMKNEVRRRKKRFISNLFVGRKRKEPFSGFQAEVCNALFRRLHSLQVALKCQGQLCAGAG